MIIPTKDCKFSTKTIYPYKFRGTAILVSYLDKIYGYFGHYPRLLLINNLPTYYHLTMFPEHETQSFIDNLGEWL